MRKHAAGAGRAHDGQLDRLAVQRDGLLAHVGRWQPGPGLRADQNRARVGGRKCFERLAAAFGQRLEEGLRVVLDAGAAGGQ